MKRFNYYKPQSLEELFELKEKVPDARFIAGGTDLLVAIKNGQLSPPALISLRSIPELVGIEIGKTSRIGALTTVSDLIQHQELGKRYPVLVEAAKCLGSVQIRNVATIGGNLCNCSPCADLALPLLVLEAKVKLQSRRASRILPLDEFFKGGGKTSLASDEILTDILLDPLPQKAKAVFLKLGRVKMDLAIVSLAVLLEVERKRCYKARLAAGAVGPVPLRLLKVEALLEGAFISEKIISKAQKLARESVDAITDIRAAKEYRQQIVGIYLKRAIEKTLERSQA